MRADEKGLCELPMLFAFRHLEIGKQLGVEGRSKMGRTPPAATLIRLKVLTPRVAVSE